jgi:hypothetical protein
VNQSGIGPAVWDGEQQVAAGLDPRVVQDWMQMAAQRDAYYEQARIGRRDQRAADLGTGMKSAATIGRVATDHLFPGARKEMLGRLGEAVGIKRGVSRGYDPKTGKDLPPLDEQAPDPWAGNTEPKALPTAKYGARPAAPTPAAPPPGVGTVAEAVKPVTESEAAAATSAAGNATAPATSIGSVIGNVAGGLAIAGGAYDLAKNGLKRAEIPHGKAGTTARAVGGVSAAAGAMAGASTGAALGSVIPGIGTVVGAVVGGTLGAIPGARRLFGSKSKRDDEGGYWNWRWY